MDQSNDNPKDDSINWPHMLFVAIITLAVFWVVLAIFPLPDYAPHGMVPKILTGNLPDCANTIGSDTGYYCQINNVSQYCKVDVDATDPFVRITPYCQTVMLV